MNRSLTFWFGVILIFWAFNPVNSWSVESVATTGNSNLPACSLFDGKKLGINSSCFTLIKAKDTENSVGLTIEAGEEYTLMVPDKQVWKDAWRENTPPCGEDGSFIMNLFSKLKRAKDSSWFSLIAEITGENKPYDVCREPNLKANGSGKLILYANDVKGFYFNNSGEILVEIQRKK